MKSWTSPRESTDGLQTRELLLYDKLDFDSDIYGMCAPGPRCLFFPGRHYQIFPPIYIRHNRCPCRCPLEASSSVGTNIETNALILQVQQGDLVMQCQPQRTCPLKQYASQHTRLFAKEKRKEKNKEQTRKVETKTRGKQDGTYEKCRNRVHGIKRGYKLASKYLSKRGDVRQPHETATSRRMKPARTYYEIKRRIEEVEMTLRERRFRPISAQLPSCRRKRPFKTCHA